MNNELLLEIINNISYIKAEDLHNTLRRIKDYIENKNIDYIPEDDDYIKKQLNYLKSIEDMNKSIDKKFLY